MNDAFLMIGEKGRSNLAAWFSYISKPKTFIIFSALLSSIFRVRQSPLESMFSVQYRTFLFANCFLLNILRRVVKLLKSFSELFFCRSHRIDFILLISISPVDE